MECALPRSSTACVVTGANVKKSDAVFLTSVLGVASVFALTSLTHAVRLLPDPSGMNAAAAGAAGEARDVDMEALESFLRSGYLSDHEAEYYKSLPHAVDFTENEPISED